MNARVLLAVAALVAPGGLALAAPPAARTLGKIKTVASDGASIEVRDEKGATTRCAVAGAAFAAFEAKKLEDLPAGQVVHILGKKRVGRRGGTISDVVAIVAQNEFDPPAVKEELAKQGYAWSFGPLGDRKRPVELGNLPVAGLPWTRLAAVPATGVRGDLKPGKLVVVEPEPAPDPSAPAAAKRIVFLAPELPVAEWKAIFGL